MKGAMSKKHNKERGYLVFYKTKDINNIKPTKKYVDMSAAFETYIKTKVKSKAKYIWRPNLKG